MLAPIINVTLTITRTIPNARRNVRTSLKISMAMPTAVTGSTAPNIATGVLPIFWMAALVQMRDIAVGKSAIQKADTHSHGLLERMLNVVV